MVFFTCYSEDYKELAERLQKSCRQFGLHIHASEVPRGKDWISTVRQKPQWILGALARFRQDVCWLDADCTMRQFPHLLHGLSEDLAAYNWASDPENPIKIPYDPNRLRVSGGVLYFKYSAVVFDLLYWWIWHIQNQPNENGTDPCLDDAFNTHRPQMSTLWLPSSYHRIDKYFPDVEPVIDHEYTEERHGAEVCLATS